MSGKFRVFLPGMDQRFYKSVGVRSPFVPPSFLPPQNFAQDIQERGADSLLNQRYKGAV
jgi:hypothetical protein